MTRSLPKMAAEATYANSTKPTVRHSTRHQVASTMPANQAGAGRPDVAASYRGLRQATARTVNETTSAAVAPAIASSGEIGRSFAPPIPWAIEMPSGDTSADFELDDDLLERVRLDVDGAGLVDALDRQRALAGLVLELLLGRGVHVDLTGVVGGQVELDLLARRDLDPLTVGADRVALDGHLDDLRVGRPGVGRRLVLAAARGREGEGGQHDGGRCQGTAHGVSFSSVPGRTRLPPMTSARIACGTNRRYGDPDERATDE